MSDHTPHPRNLEPAKQPAIKGDKQQPASKGDTQQPAIKGDTQQSVIKGDLHNSHQLKGTSRTAIKGDDPKPISTHRRQLAEFTGAM